MKQKLAYFASVVYIIMLGMRGICRIFIKKFQSYAYTM